MKRLRLVFTTAAAAKVCGCSPRMVAKWVDKGALKGYVLPLSKDRRIPRDNLIEFMKEHSIPLSQLEAFDAQSEEGT